MKVMEMGGNASISAGVREENAVKGEKVRDGA